MPQYSDFRLIQREDVLDTFVMAPPQSIAGWSIEARVSKRFGVGVSGLLVASAASGYGNGVSGITVTDSGQGTLTFPINGPATSGWNAGNYAASISRTDSGFNSVLWEGYMLLAPRN